MVNRLFIFILFGIIVLLPQNALAESKVIPVRDQGFAADLIIPDGADVKKCILVLGGSKGGIPDYLAKVFTGIGYPVLSLAYFKTENTPQTLEEIPLEYFYKAIKWMQDNNKQDRVIVAGISKGAEVALLLASTCSEIKGVIAITPSSVVWQGIPKSFWPLPDPRSSWTLNGKSLPFVPYDFNNWMPSSRLVLMYRQSLNNKQAVKNAVIHVENIKGPVILFTGGTDDYWPSPEMGRDIIKRLKDNGFKYKYEFNIYKGAGHTFLNEENSMGGTAEGNRKARLDMYEKAKAFLKEFD